jgi:hypothetical protein
MTFSPKSYPLSELSSSLSPTITGVEVVYACRISSEPDDWRTKSNETSSSALATPELIRLCKKNIARSLFIVSLHIVMKPAQFPVAEAIRGCNRYLMGTSQE